jgi:hypothetical protein
MSIAYIINSNVKKLTFSILLSFCSTVSLYFLLFQFMSNSQEAQAAFCRLTEGQGAILYKQKPKKECAGSMQQGVCMSSIVCEFPQTTSANIRPESDLYLCPANASNQSCPLPDDCVAQAWISTSTGFKTKPGLKTKKAIINSTDEMVNVMTVDHNFHGFSTTLPLSKSSTQGCSPEKAFDNVCMSSGTPGKPEGPGYINTNWQDGIFFCRESSCSNVMDCQNDPEWDVVQDAPVLNAQDDNNRYGRTRSNSQPKPSKSRDQSSAIKAN